jgi:hypothetical protein
LFRSGVNTPRYPRTLNALRMIDEVVPFKKLNEINALFTHPSGVEKPVVQF